MMIVDMSDPASVKEVSRWWVPGQRVGEGAEYKKYWFAGDGAAWNGTHSAPSVPKRIEDGGKSTASRHRSSANRCSNPESIEKWTAPYLDAGWDDQTPRSAYFGRSLRQMGERVWASAR